MAFSRSTLTVFLTIITFVLGILLAAILLLFGIANLVKPDVSAEYLALNTRNCLLMILTGVLSIYALFRFYSGGLLLFICAVVLSVVFGGFLRNPIAGAVLLLGVLSVIRGRLSRRTLLDNHDQVPRSSTST